MVKVGTFIQYYICFKKKVEDSIPLGQIHDYNCRQIVNTKHLWKNDNSVDSYYLYLLYNYLLRNGV